MKTSIRFALIALSVVSLFLAGCVSSSAPVPVTPKQEVIANAVEDALSIGLVPVLSKNPSYIGAAESIAIALGSFNGDTLTPVDVQAFLDKTPLTPQDAQTVAGIVNAAWATYSKRYAQQINATLRPDVKLFLGAVANGIHAAVNAVNAGKSPAA